MCHYAACAFLSYKRVQSGTLIICARINNTYLLPIIGWVAGFIRRKKVQFMGRKGKLFQEEFGRHSFFEHPWTRWLYDGEWVASSRMYLLISLPIKRHGTTAIDPVANQRDRLPYHAWLCETSCAPALWRHDCDVSHRNMVMLSTFQGRIAIFTDENSASQFEVNVMKYISICIGNAKDYWHVRFISVSASYFLNCHVHQLIYWHFDLYNLTIAKHLAYLDVVYIWVIDYWMCTHSVIIL